MSHEDLVTLITTPIEEVTQAPPPATRPPNVKMEPMRLIKNTGNDRVIDELRQTLAPQSSLDAGLAGVLPVRLR